MKHYNTYSSIVPSEMSRGKLKHMCIELQVARNWGMEYAMVNLKNGLVYKVEINRLKDYQEELKSKLHYLKTLYIKTEN